MRILDSLHTAVAKIVGAHTTAERYYASLDASFLRKQFEAASDPKAKVSPSVLLTIATLLAPQCRAGGDKRSLALEFNEELLAKWRSENKDAHVFVIPPLGILHYRVQRDPYLSITLSASGGPRLRLGSST